MEGEILAGLKKIGDRKIPLESVSCDSWGVDIVYLPKDGSPAKDPFCYRDGRNEKIFPKVVDKIGKEKIFARTGLQFMPFNTLYQLAADAESGRVEVGQSSTFLPVADYLNFFLGVVQPVRFLWQAPRSFMTQESEVGGGSGEGGGNSHLVTA